MDTQQLKLLAGLVRGLLQPTHPSFGYGQALDLIAALPGLRNWPEVMAFPQRVAAAELDITATGRLSFRLKKRYSVYMSPQELLVALSPPGAVVARRTPQIWPSGPVPGVYITTSQKAIDALLEVYEDATDGALLYAERAGNGCASAIDLGEYGLWSSGLDRVPSGTLLVVGPLELDQQSWEGTASRLETACRYALDSGHRVAVLLDTPTAETLHEDVRLMVTSRDEHADEEPALIGVVTEKGELQARTPFSVAWPTIEPVTVTGTSDALPTPLMGPLRDVLAERTNGLLLFGSAVIAEYSAIDLVAGSLVLTERAGPAARIMARHRATPSKDWDVPEAIRQLPFLPSIESAYAQGYRRLIYHPSYTEPELLLKYSEDALLICGTYGADVMTVFMSTVRAGGGTHMEAALLARIVAIAATVSVPSRDGIKLLADLYVATGAPIDNVMAFEEIEQFLSDNLLARWRDGLARLQDAGVVVPAEVKKAFPRSQEIKAFVDEYLKQKKNRATA
ncbi:hypothetical protein [Cupriavidus consociatus]|uniref:hypothetical protein n=1 Tax=Cupriavidus consociatus TaxID=2821357 RepID=UPI001AE34C0B|nr:MULTISPECIES: hypothetical protein [unclassified Cupriavidus]MBP0621193.1 hypothetical protein [Cupriavidus sp. LEh25]MDK2657864.1 hypothetical protein [Cupriavidus sp. LEh21]